VQGAYTLAANPVQVPLGTPAPTGTVEICLTQSPNEGAGACYSPVYSQTVPLTALTGTNAQESWAVTTFPSLAAGQFGEYFLSIQYSGDSVWAPEGLLYLNQINVQTLPVFTPTTTTLSITPTSFSGSETATVTATVTGTGNGTTSPTGEISIYDNDVFLTYYEWQSGVAGATSTLHFEVNPSSLLNSGANQLTAVYGGDGKNGPSVSNVVNFTSTQTVGDFTLAPQTPQITVQPGSTGSVGLNLTSLSNFNGAVTLSCAPSSTEFSCSVNPGSASLNGAATATLTIDAMVPAATPAMAHGNHAPRWPVAAGMLACGLLLGGGRAQRKLRRSLFLGLSVLIAVLAIGCGASISTTTTGTTAPIGSTPAGTYSVVVTGTANGMIHNAKITIVVP
jgi:hypothetical protein